MNSPRLSLSDRLRQDADKVATAAHRDYVNGNRKDARHRILSAGTSEAVAMVTARFLSLARFEPSALAFVDRFADF